MIIATAGHVDHGKTSLVKTLTGTDTDRHPEEKKRGLTIDIGFAYLRADAGNVAIIDVPGHEKFVRNMIAGVGLVDIALLVVAADDGPMPQTLEHIAILQLMSVSLVVPVISKADLVSAERATEVSNELSSLLAAAGLATSDFFELSVLDKVAVMQLRDKLLELVGSQTKRSVRGHFRMPIDRCFTIDGSGTVVTGTVSSGRLAKNDTLALVSDITSEGKTARARSLHAQNTESDDAIAGQRCAINLSGSLSKEELKRGSWLVANTRAVRTSIIDVALSAAFKPDAGKGDSNNIAVNHWTPAHLHIGTADIPCRIALLDCKSLNHGQTALARLICDRTLTAAHGDRFVLRDQSARSTIAGGRVIDVMPPRRGRSKPARLEQLAALNAHTADEVLNNLLAVSPQGIELDKFAARFNLLSGELDELVGKNNLQVIEAATASWCLTKSQSEKIELDLLNQLLELHKDNPDKLGVGLDVIYRALERKIHTEVLEHQLKVLIDKNKVVRTASVFRHVDHQVAMSSADDSSWKKVEQKLLKADLNPLRLTEIAELLEKEVEDTRRFMNHCVAHGKVFKVTDNRYFLPQTLRQLAIIAEALGKDDNLTVAEFRNESGIGRNLVVELLEYFDRCRFTQRMGNKRTVLLRVEDAFQ